MSTALVTRDGELDRYAAEIARYPLLSREQEQALARRFRDAGDIAAAHELVVSNLRFVVKVAHEYSGYGLRLLDLVQEGNIGLMHAVKKFDPARGYRLISYAVWWIRAHMQAFILRTWSLVKVGSGSVRRKLFFKLRSSRAKLEQELAGEHDGQNSAELAKRLEVSPEELDEMQLRLAARDFSLDAPLGDDTSSSHLDQLVAGAALDPEELTTARENRALLAAAIDDTREGLDEKEQVILQERLLADEPETLASIGKELGVTRERVRQIEKKVVDKLRVAFLDRAPGAI